MNRNLRSVLALSLLVGIGCSDDVQPSLDVAEPRVPRAEDSEALAQLRSQQFLTFYEHATPTPEMTTENERTQEIFSADSGYTGPSYQFYQLLEVECDYLAFVEDGNDPADYSALTEDYLECNNAVTTDSCSDAICTGRQAVCMTNLLLEMASSTAPITIHWRDDQNALTYATFPPQETIDRAALREAAAHRAAMGLTGTWTSLMDMSVTFDLGVPTWNRYEDTDLSADDCAALDSDSGKPRVEVVSTLMQELYALGRESTDRAVDEYLALADRAYSVAVDGSEGISDAIGIRAHAANLLLGTTLAPELAVRGARCHSDELGPAERRALEIIRGAAPPPAKVMAIEGRDLASLPRILDTLGYGADGGPPLPTDGGVPDAGPIPSLDPILIQDFLRGSSADSILSRLRVVRHDEDLTWDDIRAETGLRDEDFMKARAFLADEIEAFGRSWDAIATTLPDPFDPMGQVEVDMYSATGGAPRQASPFFYSMEFHAPQLSAIPYNGILMNSLFTQQMPLPMGKVLFDYEWLQFNAHADAPGAPAHLSQLRDSLEPLNREHRRTYEGFINIGSDDGLNLTTRFLTDYSAADLLMVADDDSMKCATQGTIDGTRCSWSDINAIPGVHPTVPPSNPGLPPTSDGREFVVWEDAEGNALAPYGEYYLVALRPGFTSNSVGSYEVLTAFRTPVAPLVAGENWVALAVVPYVESRAGTLLQPSTEWCGRPAIACGDFRSDARLPLENETTDDGDQYESSWRRYLSLAAQAAQEADYLGRETLELLAQIDNISEAELGRLEDICGASLSLDPVAAAVEVSPGEDPIAAVLSDAAPELGATELARLRSCLGDGSLTQFATLGDQKLCVWYLDNDPRQLCEVAEGDTSTLPCPRIPDADEFPGDASGGCETPTGAGTYTGYRIGSTNPEEIIGHFTVDPNFREASVPDPEFELCGGLRQMRQAIQDHDAAAFVAGWSASFDTGEPYFAQENVRDFGRSIRFVADHGGYSTLFVGERAHTVTGTLAGGPMGSYGLCQSPTFANLNPLVDDTFGCPFDIEAGTGDPIPRHGGSLLCTAVDCEDADLRCGNGTSGADCRPNNARAALNVRMARAAVLARWLSGNDMSGFEWPYAARTGSTNDTGHDYDRAAVTDNEIRIYTRKDDGDLRIACTQSGGTEALWLIPHLPWGTGQTTMNSERPCSSNHYDEIRIDPLDHSNAWGNDDIGHYDQLHSEEMGGRMLHELTYPPRVGDGTELVGTRYEDYIPLIGPHIFADAFNATHLADPMDAPLSLEYACPSAATGCLRNGSGQARGPWALDDQTKIFFDDQDGTQIRTGDLFDALELICEASRNPVTRWGCGPAPVGLSDESQLPFAAEQIECMAQDLHNNAGMTTLVNMPEAALDAFRTETGTGVTGESGGLYGAELIKLRQTMIELSGMPFLIATELSLIANDMQNASLAIKNLNLEMKIAGSRLAGQIADHATECLIATASNASPSGALFSNGAGVMIATCANAAVQIGLVSQQFRYQNQISDNEITQTLIQLESSAAQRAAYLTQLQTQQQSLLESMDASLLALEALRADARDALSRAMFLDSAASGAVLRSNTSLRRRLGATHVRYERSRDDAIRMAHLAKRAVEQRFGVDLRSIHSELSLVEAPATWESNICTLSGIDFNAVRDSGVDVSPETLADQYIGEYVNHLENFVESYNTDYPFTDGADQAVISLRDDVMHITEACWVDSHNLLSNAGNMQMGGETAPWRSFGCRPDLTDPEEDQPNCVRVTSYDVGDPVYMDTDGDLIGDLLVRNSSGLPGLVYIDGDGDDIAELEVPRADYEEPIGAARSPFGDPRAFSLRFGQPIERCVDYFLNAGAEPCTECQDEYCGYEPGVSSYGQEVWLPRGDYLLSWYALAGEPRAANAVQVQDTNGALRAAIGSSGTQSGGPVVVNGSWNRYWFAFTVSTASTHRIVVTSDPSLLAPDPSILPDQIEIAGLMLEDAGGLNLSEAAMNGPGVFAATDAQARHIRPVCEDTDGSAFRERVWRKNCQLLCTDGFGGDCQAPYAQEYCYWETEFHVDHRQIDRGEVFQQAGFANGNYNYRIDSLALNFVGTSARQCTDPAFPSTCYNAGFIPYTIEHRGPYVVRNHFGDDYTAQLFTGSIEHARGLAAERYLTNPMSGADASMIGQYTRTELQGRPLTGTYLLRVWEEPGVNFAGIEDVQIVLNYSYWTRQN